MLDLDLDKKATIKVVLPVDKSVNCDMDVYNSYLEDLNEEKLQLEGEPTRFVMKKVLPLKVSRRLQDEMLSIETTGKTKINIGTMLETVRCALCDIENPGKNLQYKRASDGLCSEEIIELLNTGKLITPLYLAYNHATNGEVKVKDKQIQKKS